MSNQYWVPRYDPERRVWVIDRAGEAARNGRGQTRRFSQRRSAKAGADKLNRDVRFDWSSVDWWNSDAPDPRAAAPGWSSRRYYAQPRMKRNDRTFRPREFRAGTVAVARQIIAASPEARGDIEGWSEQTQRRWTVETIP